MVSLRRQGEAINLRSTYIPLLSKDNDELDSEATGW